MNQRHVQALERDASGRRRWRGVLAVFAFAGAVMFGVTACAQGLWLSPRSDVSDLMELFKPDASWQEVALHTRVFEMAASPSYSDAELLSMFADLRRRGIGLLLGMLPLSADWSRCGVHIEGYSAYGQSFVDAQRLKGLGAEVQYFGMDEPLYFGHSYNGPRACHTSIADLAKDVAAKVRQVQSVFPTALIGDVEPVGTPSETWIADLAKWFDGFQAETGQRLAFVRADIQWKRPWRNQMRELEELLRRKGIPLQVIYNGDGDSGAEWAAKAAERFKEYETSGLALPEVPVFQSWTPYPSRLLPETEASTLTGLARQYIHWRQQRGG